MFDLLPFARVDTGGLPATTRAFVSPCDLLQHLHIASCLCLIISRLRSVAFSHFAVIIPEYLLISFPPYSVFPPHFSLHGLYGKRQLVSLTPKVAHIVYLNVAQVKRMDVRTACGSRDTSGERVS